jgi:riboflavin kinase / FMN adenylyltransferase
MQIFHDPAQLPTDYGSTVLSVGNYDGLHLGHRFLLARVVERARALHALSVAVTFEPHPSHLLRPGAGPRLITPNLRERLDLLATTGIDATVVLPFTAVFSQQSAEGFAGVCCSNSCVLSRCTKATTSALAFAPRPTSMN